ncbi:MAG: sigma 54-interacting transcriptional regulator [Planctomycetes bacterium]|nr:sigma 54-interacting transcriptional regulator [Planctomycetota bacterium]
MSSSPALQLPAGYRLLRDRSRPGAAERLIEAESAGRRVALRLSPGLGGAELRSELAVLSAIAHPGLAALLDYGPLAAGGSYVAREWVDGRDLGDWARGRTPEELGRVAARLCVALQALHDRGFVHGDLKAANVLVVDAPDGPRPVLTDFGLSRTSGERAGASGTLFHIAPELLLGGQIDAASDLFALGVMLHELLLGRRPSAREFYGKFPAFDFFEATASRADELPEWARDVVAALVEREKHARPKSAAWVGSTLAGRLGASELFREPRVELRWPVLEGRTAWCARLDAELARAPAPVLRWLYFTADEDPRALTDELALRAALHGLRVRRIDLAEGLARSRDAAEVERATAALCASHAGVLLFAALESADPWTARAAELLAHAIAGAPEDARPHGLVIGARSSVPDSALPWGVLDVPEVDADIVAHFVSRDIEVDAARATQFVELLARAAAGSATKLARTLERAVASGWIVPGEKRPRVRAGALPASLAESPENLRALDPVAARTLAALAVLGGRARLAEVELVSELGLRELSLAVQSLVDGHWVAFERSGESSTLHALAGVDGRASERVDEPRWRAMHERWSRELERTGAPRARVLPHAVRAGRATVADVVAECETLRDGGSAELALQLCDAVIAQRSDAGLAVEPELIGERALSWCAIGDADRALEALAPWSRDAAQLAPRTRAISERVHGQVAMARHETARAIEHFETASRLDPDDGGWAALGKSRLLFDLGRDRDVLALCEELRQAQPAPRLLPRVAAMLRTTEAMSLFRGGEVVQAREILEEQLADAQRAHDAAREAGLRINLATVERRAGELPRALEHFEHSAALYESAGSLPGLAQARAQFGSTLREVGELARAQPLLESALSIRERLGDRVGATNVRGMLGLLLADRGHARAAIEELERAASELRASGRSRVAVMLEARALETRARLGDRGKLSAGSASEVDRAAEGDPRILSSRARALWLIGESRSALEHAKRAEALAKSLGLAALRQEAQFLLARLQGESAPPSPSASESLVDDDVRVIALLSRAPFDAERASRLAQTLAARGRDDRAARLLLAIGARQSDAASKQAAERAEGLIAACSRGLSPGEQANFRRTLLALPDPWPEDFVAHERRRSNAEEDDMDVIGLLEINHRLLAQDDLRTLLGLIVEQALAVSGAQRGFLILEEDGELKVDTALDSRRGDIDTPDVEVSGSVLREALASMKPRRVSNAVDDPQLRSAPSVIELELRSILCVPFEVQKGLRGVIYADHRLREGAFDARAERMLTYLADQAALAILQVRRLEEIRRLNRELGRAVVRKDSDLKTAAEALRRLNVPAPAGGLVGDSAPMREVRRLIERAASSKLTVLVSGPSGSGKELAARALHELGSRREGPFVSENCAALPPSLIEAELFGARKGAYTGSDRDRDGLFERAQGGTLFLDEIGELPLELQAKLLRVLETSQVRRLGDDRLRAVDFRLVAATNRDLAREVAEQRFRADLYYRLDGLRVTMPDLASRAEDIPALVDHYLRLNAEPGHAPRKIGAAVLTKLCRRAWPGNVRELFNELARLAVMSEGDILDPELVREIVLQGAGPQIAAGGQVKPMEQLEREAILHAVQAANNDKRKAAELLGISRAKVYQRLKEWGLTGGDKGDDE